MELINFAAWLANQETVTGSQVDVNTGQVLIGMPINNKRDGSQFKTFAMSVAEFSALVAPVVPATTLEYEVVYDQIGTGVPIPRVLSNTFAGNISIQRLDKGDFTITSDEGEFIAGRTMIYPMSRAGYDITAYATSATLIDLQTWNTATGNKEDGVFSLYRWGIKIVVHLP